MGCRKLAYQEREARQGLEKSVVFLGGSLRKKVQSEKKRYDYYPFGLTFNSFKRDSKLANKFKFQGQEHIDDLGLNWDAFKWRNHQPDIGRFFNVDPLAESYLYNSPYAFSENKVVAHIELEGLEAVSIELSGRGIAPIAYGVGVSANSGVGVRFGTSNKNDGLNMAVYTTGGFGIGAGAGIMGGMSIYGHYGDIEDTDGIAFSAGAFLANGGIAATTEGFTSPDGTDFGSTIPLPTKNVGLGGGAFGEISGTVFLVEPFKISDMGEEQLQGVAERLNLSVDELNTYIGMANSYIKEMKNDKIQSFENSMKKFEDEMKSGYVIPSDNTKIVNN